MILVNNLLIDKIIAKDETLIIIYFDHINERVHFD